MRNEASVDAGTKAAFLDHQPTAATAAIATVAADAEQFWVLDWVAWSYDADPTAGNVKVEIGGVTVFSADIPSKGPGIFNFRDAPLYVGTKNQTLVVTLASGGGAVVGKVNIRYR